MDKSINPELSPIDRYYTAWAIVGELLASILLSAAAKTIGVRLATLAEGGWLPGMGDARMIGALTGRPTSSINDVAGTTPRPKFKVGRQTFYRLDGFAQDDTTPRKKRRAK